MNFGLNSNSGELRAITFPLFAISWGNCAIPSISFSWVKCLRTKLDKNFAATDQLFT